MLASLAFITLSGSAVGGCASTSQTWRIAWGATLDDYVANAPWTAHPTEPGSATVADATYRFVVRLTVGGSALRLRLANVRDGRIPSGIDPVTIGAVDVGIRRTGSAAGLVPGTIRRVRFAGRYRFVIPPGASAVSDPIGLRVRGMTDLAVSLYAPHAAIPPLHALTYVTQYHSTVDSGDHAGDLSGSSFTEVQQPIYWLDAVDVLTNAPRSVIAIGDSITDGAEGPSYTADFGMDKFPTYPDWLVRRVISSLGVGKVAVANEGVIGDSSRGVINRLEHDVLDQPGVTDVVVEVGTNDLTLPAAMIIHNLSEIAAKLRDHHLHVMGATLVPQGGFVVDSPSINATRARVNAFVRRSPLFDDGVLDIAKALGRPGDDNVYQPRFDSGDHLHPNTAGYRAIAGSFNLAVLR